MENSIEEDIKILRESIIEEKYYIFNKDLKRAIENLLSDYKRVLKENEELTISNKEIDKECSRLEKKEVELINENEHYKDLIYALKTYYDITEEDFEIVQKQDEIDIGDIQETEIKNDGINYYEYKNNGATESGYSKNYSVNDIETRLKINELVQALKQLDKRVRKLED